MKFSEKYGYTKVRDVIQLESMDLPLRNLLWNVLTVEIWKSVQIQPYEYGAYLSKDGNENILLLCQKIWIWHFKKTIDDLSDEWEEVLAEIKKYFFNCHWYDVYDFIEFIFEHYKNSNFKKSFPSSCNNVLQTELAAYRFVDGVITKITDNTEISEIEAAIDSKVQPVQIHLQRALELLSSRDSPDYRNSIKESISAVESLAQKITGDEKATLGSLLPKLEKNHKLHPALNKAYSNLYGYTSNDTGIRHALSDTETIQFEDAKYFLVICSAFINYITAKNAA